MDTAEKFLYHLKKLETLLENDRYTADKNMQGGFVPLYRRGLEKEMDQLQELIRNVKNHIC